MNEDDYQRMAHNRTLYRLSGPRPPRRRWPLIAFIVLGATTLAAFAQDMIIIDGDPVEQRDIYHAILDQLVKTVGDVAEINEMIGFEALPMLGTQS